MTPKQPKQTLTVIATMFFLTILVISCNNSADSSKAPADSTKAVDTTSKMSTTPDTTKKADTTKMDTATTRPVKTTN